MTESKENLSLQIPNSGAVFRAKAFSNNVENNND